MRFLRLLVVVLFGLIASPIHAELPPTNTATDAADTVFFAFDNQNIAWQQNLKLTLVPPTKHPANPVVRCGPKGAPDHGHAILYGTVIHDGEKFRMWYLGMIQREIVAGQAPGYWRPMCYAESADGINWTKPDLGLVGLNDSKENNICLIEAEVPSMALVNDFLSVLYDPADPDPSRRFKASYIAHMPYDDIRGGMSGVGIKERRVSALVCATSADGLRWKCVGDRPANAGGERFEVSSLYRFGPFYYSSGQLASPWSWLADGRPVGRMMTTYRSPDFVRWSQARALSMVLPEQQTEEQPEGTKMLEGFGRQMHMGVGVWNRGNVLVGVPGIWQGVPADRPKDAPRLQGLKIDLGLAVSNDGVHFREPVPNFKLIEHGSSGEWDQVALLQGHAFVNVGEQTYIWYSHWDCEGQFRSQEIGLATIRRDGFGYLSAKQPELAAFCETANFTTTDAGTKVFVNIDGATADKPIRIELLDELAEPVAGFSGNDAAVVAASGVRTEVTWKSTLPAGKKFGLRVHFPAGGEAKLYAAYATNN